MCGRQVAGQSQVKPALGGVLGTHVREAGGGSKWGQSEVKVMCGYGQSHVQVAGQSHVRECTWDDFMQIGTHSSTESTVRLGVRLGLLWSVSGLLDIIIELGRVCWRSDGLTRAL